MRRMTVFVMVVTFCNLIVEIIGAQRQEWILSDCVMLLILGGWIKILGRIGVH